MKIKGGVKPGLLSYPFCPDDYPADFRINQLRFAKNRLRFAWVSPGVVCGTDPGSGLSPYTVTRPGRVTHSVRLRVTHSVLLEDWSLLCLVSEVVV